MSNAWMRAALARSVRWCDVCQAPQVMETLEDGTRECVVCRLRQESERELQPPLPGESDDPEGDRDARTIRAPQFAPQRGQRQHVGVGSSPTPTCCGSERPGTRTLNPLIKSQLEVGNLPCTLIAPGVTH
jgi:hypothetical protein